ncbi:DsbA family protein [Pelagerythrobacter sp.]|uniref:DsbA family protein n=1 Tax=Pelagerythrobacter sp. TaxID=2800702 RepID=UPI0035B0E54F
MTGRNYFLAALLALLFGFAGAALWSLSGLGDRQVRGYLLDHPEVLAEMADAYQAKQASERLSAVAGEVAEPFPGAVLGNPEGSVTLVEFTDYGCTYCRMSKPEVDRLVADNPDLRVVIREWPIFRGSEEAARMALAAAQQGKFAAFHDAMFALGPPDAASIEKAARAAGLDLAAAREFASSETATREIAKTMRLAETLGFTGTPSWVVGGKVIEGAVGYDGLDAAIGDARGS